MTMSWRVEAQISLLQFVFKKVLRQFPQQNLFKNNFKFSIRYLLKHSAPKKPCTWKQHYTAILMYMPCILYKSLSIPTYARCCACVGLDSKKHYTAFPSKIGPLTEQDCTGGNVCGFYLKRTRFKSWPHPKYTEAPCGFTQSIRTNFRTGHRIRLRPFRSKPSPPYYSPVLPSHAMEAVKMAATLK